VRLVFKQPRLSISSFHPIELPELAVLTGVNGSGKSHLLEAIQQKKVVYEGFEEGSVVLFSYETFKLDQEALANAVSINQERESLWSILQNNVKPESIKWKAALGDGYAALSASSIASGIALWNAHHPNIKSYKQAVRSYFLQPNFKQQPQWQAIYGLAQISPYTLDEVPREYFDRHISMLTLKNDFLPQQIGKIIWDYFVKQRNNQVNEYQSNTHSLPLPYLSPQDFRTRYGVPPWEIINEILLSFDSLSYEIESPEKRNYFDSYQLKLRHKHKSDLEVDFHHLSSGERILMALVASVYKANTTGQFPDILLLDEIDASLHPSMMRNLLDVIRRVFLPKGVKVILITHSATTVALAPEESIFVMNRTGVDRIQKKSKSDALKILTDGYATLNESLEIFSASTSFAGITIMTEGNNAKILTRYLELSGETDVRVIRGLEGITGKDQLKTLFDFFAVLPHRIQILFVFDCDVGTLGREEKNQAFHLTLPKQEDNYFAKSGIENMIPQKFVTAEFVVQGTDAFGNPYPIFNKHKKQALCEKFIAEAQLSDYSAFACVLEKLKQIRNYRA
jgi:predicted ATPase